MKPLRKPTSKANCPHRKRFQAASLMVRKALKIDGYRYEYYFDAKSKGETTASFHVFDQGDHICITFHPSFWANNNPEWQWKVFIHEHVHSVLNPNTQAYNAIVNRMHDSDIEHAKALYSIADERVTCHLESVLFDLLKDRIEKL